MPPEVAFTAVQLLRWLEGLADKHRKDKLRENAWDYVQALLEQDVTNGKELLQIAKESWWEKNRFPLTHLAIIRDAIGNDDVRTPAKANRFANPAGISASAASTMSGGSADSAIMLSGLAEIMKESRESLAAMQMNQSRPKQLWT